MASVWLGHRARSGPHCWAKQVFLGPAQDIAQPAQVQPWRVRVVKRDLCLGARGEALSPLGSGGQGSLALAEAFEYFTMPPSAPSGIHLGLWTQQLPAKGSGHRAGAGPGEEACSFPWRKPLPIMEALLVK